MNKTVAIVAATTLVAGSVFAAVISDYSTDFTSGDGFSDTAGVTGIDGWAAGTVAQHYTTATASYGSAVLNANGPSMVQTGAGGTLAVGDSVTLSSSVFYTDATGNCDVWLGLTEGTTANASVRAGLFFRRTAAGAITATPKSVGGTENGANTTISGFTAGIGQVNAISLSATVKKTATANTFDVTWNFGAESDTFQVVNSTLYGATDVYGLIDYNGKLETQVDSYSQTVIPEPGTLGLIAVFGGGVLFIRRRFMI